MALVLAMVRQVIVVRMVVIFGRSLVVCKVMFGKKKKKGIPKNFMMGMIMIDQIGKFK